MTGLADDCSYEVEGIDIDMGWDYDSRINNAGLAGDVRSMPQAQEDRMAVGDSPLVQALGWRPIRIWKCRKSARTHLSQRYRWKHFESGKWLRRT